MLNGGDIDWITHGLKACDQRVAKFAEINEILAFQPWKVSSKHIEELLTKSQDGPGWNF